MKKKHPPVHSVLPPEAIRMLQRAARTPVTQEDPLARTKAIDKTTEQVKRKFPQFFKE